MCNLYGQPDYRNIRAATVPYCGRHSAGPAVRGAGQRRIVACGREANSARSHVLIFRRIRM